MRRAASCFILVASLAVCRSVSAEPMFTLDLTIGAGGALSHGPLRGQLTAFALSLRAPLSQTSVAAASVAPLCLLNPDDRSSDQLRPAPVSARY